MEWNRCQDTVGLPEVDKDVYLLIKPEELPFLYLLVIWDGKNLWHFTNSDHEPFAILHPGIHFYEWSYIE